jgi:hypothetical protein
MSGSIKLKKIVVTLFEIQQTDSGCKSFDYADGGLSMKLDSLGGLADIGYQC